MSGDGSEFPPRFQRLLSAEQRRQVLATIGAQLDLSTTLGEIVDAAALLGWHDGMGALRLVDLAQALLSEPAVNDAGAQDDDDDAPQTAAKAKPAAAVPGKSAKKKVAKKAASKPEAKAAKKAAKATAKKTAKKTTKQTAKKKSAKQAAEVVEESFDDRMSLQEAVDAFVPLVKKIGDATMEDLETATGLGRRKLRFHIGQLVKHGHLTRHGMGRGTFYSV